MLVKDLLQGLVKDPLKESFKTAARVTASGSVALIPGGITVSNQPYGLPAIMCAATVVAGTATIMAIRRYKSVDRDNHALCMLFKPR